MAGCGPFAAHTHACGLRLNEFPENLPETWEHAVRTLSPGTRQRILDAAARLFAARRFHEVRMDDVASEAGVGKGALYRYFRDKEDLYAALVTTATKQLLRVVEQQIARGSAPETKLKELVATLIDFFD